MSHHHGAMRPAAMPVIRAPTNEKRRTRSETRNPSKIPTPMFPGPLATACALPPLGVTYSIEACSLGTRLQLVGKLPDE